jgi:protocatechuate 3,4-dioxygenase beta subunit
VVNAKTNSPLAHASVRILDARDQRSNRTVTASDDGHFEFRVMAGKFGLMGAKQGFITSYYNAHEVFSSAVVTGVGLDTEHLTLRLPPEAVLSGKVLDESGEPVRDAEVHIYREDRTMGISRVVSATTAATDDQGVYEATPLAAGTYFVAVHAGPWYAVHPLAGRDVGTVDRSLDVAYPITYYGDVTQADEATPIPVRGGDHLEADIHLSPVPAVHLSFRSDNPRGTSISVVAPTFDGFEEIRSTDLQPVSPGVYELNGLPPGQYQVGMPDAAGQLKAPKEMQITGDEELDSSSARPVAEIKATLQMRNGTKLPEDLSLALRSNPGNRLVGWERAGEKGEVDFSDVAPGRYDLVTATSERAYSVDHISTAEGKTPGKSIDVPDGASLEISVSLVGSTANVQGQAKRAGKPVSGAMIVLVPDNPEANQELFRRDQSDLDGTFNLPNVIPGSYTVIAIEDGWDLDWAKSAVLARFLPKGQPVKVTDDKQGPLHLSAAVEVQKK